MTSEAAPSPESELMTGRHLVSMERRYRLIEQLKIAGVIVVMVSAMLYVLLRMRFDPSVIPRYFNDIFIAAGTTIYISLISIVIASTLALIGALGRMSHNVVFNGASALYVSVVRGTPLLIQIFLIYNGLPRLVDPLVDLGVSKTLAQQMLVLPAIPVGIVALSFNYGAYMTEIFRAGIQSISHGQREAAEAIGMTPWQTMWRIILPQALRVILPDVGNQFIAMQKDSSLVSVIGVWEITFVSTRLGRGDIKHIMELYLLAALMYWALTIISSWGQQWLEVRMAHAYER